MDDEIKLAYDELKLLTGFNGSRSDFHHEFLFFLKEKDVSEGDAVKICKIIQQEIKINPIFDIENRLNELMDECYIKRNLTLCSNCHGNLLANANFCTHCGKKIPDFIKNQLEINGD